MPTLHLQLDRTTAPATASPNVLAVAGMFGLGLDDPAHRTLCIIPPVTLQLPIPGVVFVTGASGSGKSSLLQLIAAQVPQAITFDSLEPPLPGVALVDAFGDAPLPDVLRWLTTAGLSDAFVMLRRPHELSDGQRYRLRMAQMMAAAEGRGCGDWGMGCGRQDTPAAPASPHPTPQLPLSLPTVILADEFGATLDRITAAVLARNIRKWVSRRSGVCFVAATTHDDLLEHLDPDVLVEKSLDGGIEVVVKNPKPEARNPNEAQSPKAQIRKKNGPPPPPWTL